MFFLVAGGGSRFVLPVRRRTGDSSLSLRMTGTAALLKWLRMTGTAARLRRFRMVGTRARGDLAVQHEFVALVQQVANILVNKKMRRGGVSRRIPFCCMVISYLVSSAIACL